MWASTLAVVVLLATTAEMVSGSVNEARLYDDLLSNYHKLVRPAANITETVNVNVTVTLQEYELDVHTNEIVLSLWMNLAWEDYRLRWDPEDYALAQSVRVMPDQLWMPDIMPFNMLPHPRLDWLSPVPVVIYSSGEMLYVAPASVRVRCRRMHISMEQFSCRIKFGSWTTDGYTMDLLNPTLDLSSLLVNPLWSIQGHTMKRDEVFYTCCDEPYISVTLDLNIGRRDSVAGRQWQTWPNLAVTVTLILCLASFLVPVTSLQKLTLPSLAVVVAGTAVVTEYGLQGTQEYRLFFVRVYHVYTYVAVGCLLWAVLMMVVGRPRALRLPGCLRVCLRSWLSAVCCLESPPTQEDKGLCHEWTALAETADRVAALVFLVLVVVGGVFGSAV